MYILPTYITMYTNVDYASNFIYLYITIIC